MIDTAKLRWTGHVVRMNNDRIPKALLYGRLATGRPKRGNHNTYLNSVKSTLRACKINATQLEGLASDRNNWRVKSKEVVIRAEKVRIKRLTAKRERRKARAGLAHLRN